jgi:hypothetical protein
VRRASARRRGAGKSFSRRRPGCSSARRFPTASRRIRSASGHLKDIDQPEQVYELAIDGVSSDAHEVPAEPPEAGADFGDLLKASIEQRVQRELLKALGDQETSVEDDEEVDELAGRADLGERIAARVDAALRAKGITRDRD